VQNPIASRVLHCGLHLTFSIKNSYYGFPCLGTSSLILTPMFELEVEVMTEPLSEVLILGSEPL